MDNAKDSTILIVEDERGVVDLLSSLLHRHGYRVRAVSTGAEGLAAAQDPQITLALLDIGLPDMSGFDLCLKIKEHRPLLPVIVLSVRKAAIDIVTGLDSGADDYVTKPFSPSILLARIRAALRAGAARASDARSEDVEQTRSWVSGPEPSTAAHATPMAGRASGRGRDFERKVRLLTVTDDLPGFQPLRSGLESAGFQILDTSRGSRAIELVQTGRVDFLLLAEPLKDMEGLAVCERVRRFSNIPIIIVTDSKSEREKVWAFAAGADDYLVKPVSHRELLARVQAVLRRIELPDLFEPPPPVKLNGFEIRSLRHEIETPSGKVKLTPTEHKLLHYLASNAGRVLTHEQLLTKVWGPECDYQMEYLWVNISRLRKKIEPDPTQPCYILTEPGIGYYFRSPNESRGRDKG